MGTKRKATTRRKPNKKIKSNSTYVISIDVGVVNFAYTILKDAKVLTCQNRKVCNFRGSKDYVQMCETVFGFFEEHVPRSSWGETELVIERQMKTSIMRIFAVSLEVAWFHITGKRAHVISPILVKRYFGTSKGKYKANKHAAIQLMPTICQRYPSVRKTWLNVCTKNMKIDDLADSIIQSIYFIENDN